MSGKESIVINEFVASNSNTIADEDGDYEDWIELYNIDSVPHSLLGYHITDDIDNPFRWAFPDIELNPGEFLLIFASGKNRTEGELHTNFSISASGEPLLLTGPGGVTSDYIEAVEVPTDVSYGRIPDGGDKFYFFAETTPGYTNYDGIKFFLPESDIMFSHPGGFYTEGINLELLSDKQDITIYYTLDGSLPDLSSNVYTKGIQILKSEELEVNPIIYLPTTSPNVNPNYYWKEPLNSVFQANVVRVRAFRGDTAVSEVFTQSYFISEDVFERFSLPVFSITLPEGALFDIDTGIFVPGRTYFENPETIWSWGTGNFHNRGNEWERRANIEFFETNYENIINQEIGIRIHGGGSRALPMKSLRLYPRNIYGKNTLEHTFFEGDTISSFRRLILRNSGLDFSRTMLTDALTHEMLTGVDIEKMAYRPAIVFINGAYWGIMNIRERMDKHYIDARKVIDPDNIDLLEFADEVVEGDAVHYHAMLDYLRESSPLTQYQLKTLNILMDVDNFIDYYITKIYIGVYDWPGNNIRFWRERKVGSKWRWLYFDNDDAFLNLDFNGLVHATNAFGYEWPNPVWSTELFRLLLESPAFREQFVNRFAWHLKHTFSVQKVSSIYIDMIRQIEQEIPYHISRWQYPENLKTWEFHVISIMHYLSKRPCVMRDMLIDFFDLSIDYLPELCQKNENKPSVVIYPNPSNGHVNVIVNSETPAISEVHVFNVLGQMVFSKKSIFSHGETKLDVLLPAHLPQGTYFIRININDEIIQARLMLF